jgi:hypothetical protein
VNAAPLLLALLAVGAAGAGCIQVHVDTAPTSTPEPTAAPGIYPVTCLLVDENRTPLHAGSCAYRFGTYGATVAVDGNGTAVRGVPAGLSGTLAGEAPGHAGRQASFTVDGPKSVRIALPRLAPGARPPPAAGGPAGSLSAAPGQGLAPANVSLEPRLWLPAVAVDPDGSGGEPQVAVSPDGTVYYSPLSKVYRSTDGGRSFEDVTPGLADGAGPVLAADTALAVAPDGSVWFADDWPYAGQTQACASADRGSSWTCSAFALPGATDRMWVAGVSATEGYLETGEALSQRNWLRTTTGSLAYVPHATGGLGQLGNMVYDPVGKGVWQIGAGDPQEIARIDTSSGTVAFRDTTVPGSFAIAWLAIADGVFWTSGEKDGRVVVGRSTDQGQTWALFPVSVAPKSAVFSYVAAGPGGRAAVVYYGSDKAGPSTDNHGLWSLYVAETDDGLSSEPTWVETQLVPAIHEGNLCIGLDCEQSGGDTHARMAGDLIGIAMDADGNVHVAYVRDAGGPYPNEYRRQVRVA